jgi:hypothetical protein
MVQTDKAGIIQRGKIVHLEGSITQTGSAENKVISWNGEIYLASLDRKWNFQSPVQNGYVTAFHQRNRFRADSHEAEGQVMPEVIITYTIPSGGGGIAWTPWFGLQIPSWDGASGGSGGYYVDFSGSGGGGYGSGSSGSGSTGSDSNDPVIHVDMETQDTREGIDIQKYIKCFSNIPDQGAICSIEISADIPVDANPNAFFDFATGSPGHVFITLTKKNGSRQASQNIGFYPKSGYKAMTYAPTGGKLVDNAGHEFNASFFMNISPAQLSTALVRMQQLSNANYDVDGYNCTDWALEVFNSVRPDRLRIPLYGIPNSPMTQGSQTPQGLYQQLQKMMNSGHPEKGNITIGIIKGYAGGSTGPCN